MIVSLLTNFYRRFALFIILIFLALSANGQWLAGYEYRKSITIPDANIIGGPHTDFPLLVDLSADADIPVDANSAQGFDIVFTDSDELTILDHEIVVYDRTNYKAFVRMDLPDLSDKTIYVYYGNPTISSDPSTSDTYSGDFQAIWHMEEEPQSTSVLDATQNSNTANPNNFSVASSVGGKIGQAISFNGVSSHYLDVSNSSSINLSGNQFTIQAWINAPDNTTDNAIMAKGQTDGQEQYMLGIGSAGSPDYVIHRSSINGTQYNFTDGSITAGSWQHVVYVYDENYPVLSRLRVYVNGILANSRNSFGGNVDASVYPLLIGKRLSSANYITGLLDELRITDVARDINWIQTEFNNQNAPVGFVTYGAETGPGPLPDVQATPAAETICAGETTNIAFSTPNANPVTSYQWTAVFDTGISGNASGTGNFLTETLENTNSTAGTATYTVTAYNGVYPGYSTNVIVTVNPNPEKTVTASETTICENTSTFIVVDNSEVGTSYQLRDAGDSDIGPPQNGTGGSLSFPTGDLSSTTTFKIVATNTGNSCSREFTDQPTVTVTAAPDAPAVTFVPTVYCVGDVISSPSVVGSNIQWYEDAALTIPVTVSTPNNPDVGELGFSSAAPNVTNRYVTQTVGGCESNPEIVTLTVVPDPVVYDIGGGGTYCSGGSGVDITLSDSEIGMSYQLYRQAGPDVAVGDPIAGTGNALSMGLQTVAGTYYIEGSNNQNPSCTSTMNGTVDVIVRPLPIVYDVEPVAGTTFCSGGSVDIQIPNSQTNINYEIYRNGTPTGDIKPGTTGSSVSWTVNLGGVYTVFASHSTIPLCTIQMSGSVTVSETPDPVVTFNVTGGGIYCSGGAGMAVGLDGSEVGVEYQLLLGAAPVGTPVAGTGGGISFGLQTAAGTYTVEATTTTTPACGPVPVNGGGSSTSVTIVIRPLPTIYNVQVVGSTSYCVGSPSVEVELSSSEAGITYELLCRLTECRGRIK
jgi:hypothetical protein